MTEDVLEQALDGVGERLGTQRHDHRRAGGRELAGTALLFGEDPPEGEALANDGGQIGRPAPFRRPSPGVGDDGVDVAVQPVDVLEEALALLGVVEPLDAQPQGRQWCAQPMRKVGHGLTFCGEQVVESVGELVERLAHRLHFVRAPRFDAGIEVAAGETPRCVGELMDRRHGGPAQPIGECHGAGDECDPKRSKGQPGRKDTIAEGLDGHEGPHHGGSVRTCHRDEHLDPSVVVGGEGDAGGRGQYRLVGLRGESDDRTVGEEQRRPRILARQSEDGWSHRGGRSAGERLGDREGRRDRPGFALGIGHRAVVRLAADEEPERQDEGDRHHRRDREHEQGDVASHVPGSTSLTPTPYTVRRYRASAAVSPSFLRSHDRCTSTVLSLPP